MGKVVGGIDSGDRSTTVGPPTDGNRSRPTAHLGESPIRRALARRRPLVLIVVAALLAIGVTVLIGKAAGYSTMLESLRAAQPSWLVLCLAGEVLAYAGYVLVFRGVVRFGGGPALDLSTSIGVVFASLAATRLVAAGGAGGLALDYWALRKSGAARHDAIVRVLGLNTLLYASFGAAAWLAALFLLLGAGEGAPLSLTLPWLAGVLACFLAAVWVGSPARSAKLSVRPTGGWLGTALADAVAGVALVRGLLRDPRGRHAALGAPLYWAGDVLCLWAALRAFDVRISIAAVVLGYATGYLATLLPLPTGGVGGIEAAMTFALTVFGAALAPAALGVFAYRAFSFWLPTVPGVLSLPLLPRLERELERVARERSSSA